MSLHNTAVAAILAVVAVYPNVGLTVTQCDNDGLFHKEGNIIKCKIDEVDPQTFWGNWDFIDFGLNVADSAGKDAITGGRCTNVKLRLGNYETLMLRDLKYDNGRLFGKTTGLQQGYVTDGIHFSMECTLYVKHGMTSPLWNFWRIEAEGYSADHPLLTYSGSFRSEFRYPQLLNVTAKVNKDIITYPLGVQIGILSVTSINRAEGILKVTLSDDLSFKQNAQEQESILPLENGQSQAFNIYVNKGEVGQHTGIANVTLKSE